jgi:CRISP-associated protein Cas1
MKKLLNSLYITKQQSYVHKERDTIVIEQGGEKLGQFPSLVIANILCFGQVSTSPALMGYCAEQGIGLSYYTEYGRFLAQVQGRQTGNVLLRRTQYRVADDPIKSNKLAQTFVGAKIANARSVVLRELRNHGENEKLDVAATRLKHTLAAVGHSHSVDQTMGHEGEPAAVYFGAFNELLRSKAFEFNGRVRRPPTDPVNAMLSFVYALITQECVSALCGVGLDPYVGFLHQDRPGRVSLALDLMEEFRSAWADRFVLTLVNRGQVEIGDFVTEASGAVSLKEDSRKVLLTAYQERKQEEVMHPYLNEKVKVGLLPHCQALLLARHLRGDLAAYPPYLLR